MGIVGWGSGHGRCWGWSGRNPPAAPRQPAVPRPGPQDGIARAGWSRKEARTAGSELGGTVEEGLGPIVGWIHGVSVLSYSGVVADWTGSRKLQNLQRASGPLLSSRFNSAKSQARA